MRIAVSGQRFSGESASGLHYRDAASGLGIWYSNVTWIDATGQRTHFPALRSGDHIELRVPRSVLVASAYPAVLDPIIGPEFGMDAPIPGPAAETQQHPAIGHAGAPNADFLVVWEDKRRTANAGYHSELFGAHVNRQGVVINQIGFIVTDPLEVDMEHTQPAIAWDSNNSTYVIVYRDSAGDIAGRIILGAGSTTSAALPIPKPGTDCMLGCSRPDIVWSGGYFALAWEAPTGIWGITYTLSGSTLSPVSGPVQSIAPAGAGSPRISAASSFGVTSNFLVVGAYGSGTIFKRLLSPAGTVTILPNLYTYTPGAAIGSNPSAAWIPNASEWIVSADMQTTSSHIVSAWRVSELGATISIAFPISSGSSGYKGSSIASNFEGGALVTYGGYPAPGLVYGRIIAPSGATGISYVSPQVSLGGITNIAGGTVRAHADDYDRYFAAWYDLRHTSGDIYGALLGYNGALISPPNGFLISGGANRQSAPAVHSCNETYLVAWHDNRSDHYVGDVYGALLDSSGAVVANNIPIGVAPGGQYQPRIACDGEAYFVVWSDGRNGTDFDLWGQEIDASTGAVLLAPGGVQLTFTSDHEIAGSVAYGNGRYEVAYTKLALNGNRTVEAVPVKPRTGLPSSPPRTVYDESVGKMAAGNPGISFGDGVFCVVFETISLSEPAPDRDIFASIFSDDPSGSAFPVETDPAEQRLPQIAWDGVYFEVVYEDERNAPTAGTDIYARGIESNGAVLPEYKVAFTSVDEVWPQISVRKKGYAEVVYTRQVPLVFDTDVYGQGLDGGNQATLGPAYALAAGVGDRERYPDVACSGDDDCVCVYQDYDGGSAASADRVMGRALTGF